MKLNLMALVSIPEEQIVWQDPASKILLKNTPKGDSNML